MQTIPHNANPSISIVIPSWNGLHLLRENLPSVLEASRSYRKTAESETEIIVVDDGSTDRTLEVLPNEFPEIRLVAKPVNEGFAKTCNAGFRECRFPLVALLNNDVRVQRDYLIHKAGHFQDPNVFAVTAKVFNWEGTLFLTGGRFGNFRRGLWSVYFNYDVSTPEGLDWIQTRRLLSVYAIGGFATFDRLKLIQLEGFNPLLSPIHWEDVDLSYRGWKQGWEVRYEPRSIAFHRVSATIDRNFTPAAVETVSVRNRLLFHWVNLHSTDFLARHLAGLLVLTLTRIFVLDRNFYRALGQALRHLGQALKQRGLEKQRARVSDREVQRKLRAFYRTAPIRIYYNERDVIRRHPEFVSLR